MRRSSGSAEGGGAHAACPFGQNDPRCGALNRELPLVARHVPVELVVVLEEFEAVSYPVAENHGASRVVRFGYPDLDLQIVTVPGELALERVSLLVRHPEDVDEEAIVEATGRAVFDRNRPVDPVPRAEKARLDRLGYEK